MTDDNPYRFTGGAAQRLLDDATERPFGRLRTISRLRSLLRLALAVYVPSLLVFLVVSAAQGPSPPTAPTIDVPIAGLANVAMSVGYMGVVICGVMLIPRACPRFSRATTVLILMPVLNAVIAILAIRESKQMLQTQGVRVGWFACDYSQAEVSVRIAEGQRR